TGGIITDTVPANTSLVQIFEGGTQQGNSVVWNLATGNPGSTATVHFRVQVQQGASGAVNNVAQVRSNEQPNGIASNTATTTISSPPQLSLTKQADRQQAAPGDVITFIITATNNGQGTATNVQITDPLPGN